MNPVVTTRTESSQPARPGAFRRRIDRWRRLFSGERRRLRESFTREKLVDFLKTMAWVIPLTLLIWLYAEREQVATDSDVPLPIEVTINDATRVVTLIEPEDRIVRAEMRGPRANLDRLRRNLGPRRAVEAIQVEVDAGYSPGREHEIRAAPAIANHPLLLNHGIDVRRTEPANLRVFVDEYEEVQVRVQPPPGLRNLEGEPTFDPPMVTVRAPRRRLEEAQRRGELAVYANLANLEAGEHDLKDVPLMRSPALLDATVSITPLRVHAVVRVRQPDVEHVIRSMPVWPLHPPGLLDAHRVIHDPTLANVTVVGPPEQIERLQREEVARRPVAVLDITPEDLRRLDEPRTRRVRYLDLPPGVRLTPESEAREVGFRVVERGVAD